MNSVSPFESWNDLCLYTFLILFRYLVLVYLYHSESNRKPEAELNNIFNQCTSSHLHIYHHLRIMYICRYMHNETSVFEKSFIQITALTQGYSYIFLHIFHIKPQETRLHKRIVLCIFKAIFILAQNILCRRHVLWFACIPTYQVLLWYLHLKQK